jgi:hypothetical protein
MRSILSSSLSLQAVVSEDSSAASSSSENEDNCGINDDRKRGSERRNENRHLRSKKRRKSNVRTTWTDVVNRPTEVLKRSSIRPRLHTSNNETPATIVSKAMVDASSTSSNYNTHHDSIARGGVACPFPWKLHDMLEYCTSNEYDDCTGITDATIPNLVTWNRNGTAFAVLNAKLFVQVILPRYVATVVLVVFLPSVTL